MYRTERVFVLTAVIFMGLAFTLAMSGGLLGTDFGPFPSLLWVIAATLVVLAGAGALWLRSGVPAAVSAPLLDVRLPVAGLPMGVVVPALMVAGFVVFLQMFESGWIQALILSLAAMSFGAVYWAQAHSANPGDRYFGLAQFLLNVIGHLTAFLLFSVIYGLKLRSLYSATAVGVVSTLLVYEMLSRDVAWHQATKLPVGVPRRTVLLLSLAVGLLLSEITWGLNYWAALTTLIGGAFLLVVFYVVHGLASHYVDRTLTRSVLVEFGVVGALNMLATFLSAFFDVGSYGQP